LNCTKKGEPTHSDFSDFQTNSTSTERPKVFFIISEILSDFPTTGLSDFPTFGLTVQGRKDRKYLSSSAKCFQTFRLSDYRTFGLSDFADFCTNSTSVRRNRRSFKNQLLVTKKYLLTFENI
jgi:hypothetical protein